MDLETLMYKYGSDKAQHGYTPMYHAILKHMRNQPVDLLEVGIGTIIPDAPSTMRWCGLGDYKPGGSLRAWRDYFPNGRIVGVDVQPDTQFTEERIDTFLADSSSAEQLNKVLGSRTFHVIVDDGLHHDETQIKTMQNLWPRVRPGGYYIIEDIEHENRIPTTLRHRIAEIIGNDGYFFLSEHTNFLVASRK